MTARNARFHPAEALSRSKQAGAAILRSYLPCRTATKTLIRRKLLNIAKSYLLHDSIFLRFFPFLYTAKHHNSRIYDSFFGRVKGIYLLFDSASIVFDANTP